MNIFCISGLGADERIFSNLQLPQHSVRHLPWLTPEKKETLRDYTKRMASGIDVEEPVLIGVSFGGMIAIEISKMLPVKKIILISSIKTKFEKPFYFKAAAALRLNRIIPLRPYKFLEPIENYNLGIHSKEEKKLAAEYRSNLDIAYSNWALEQVLHWNNTEIPGQLIHIHGSKDHIFPLKYIKPDYVIRGGGHLMVMNRANEISQIIQQFLKSTS